MPKVPIRGNTLTLPDDLRDALSARCKAGLADLRTAQAGVRYRGPEPRPSAEEEERQIADLLAADKAARGTTRKR